ncbi:hypothetical protein, partial [Actinocorallia libanotica]
RPQAARELAEAFDATCGAATQLLLVVDHGDPSMSDYTALAAERDDDLVDVLVNPETPTMVGALNYAASWALDQRPQPDAIAFMGDDHRPRTTGWDAAYLQTLHTQPGMVFGTDLLQGPDLPTQIAISTSVIETLGHMVPPDLVHLYADNYWADLGRGAGCLTYLPDVIVEHLHPVTGKVPWSEGHRRVNTPEAYHRDREAYRAYREAGQLQYDVEQVREALARQHLSAWGAL